MEWDLRAWARLHEENPVLFEERKRDALEHLIAGSRSPQTLRRLLDRISALDAEGETPVVAYERLLHVLRQRLGDEILPALEELGRRLGEGVIGSGKTGTGSGV